MTKLGTAITEAIIYHYGSSAFLSRLSDPFWFQALGAVMGMDWHSSGITTSVMGALKRGLGPRADELGIYICGGRGRFSRNTPQELRSIAERRAFDVLGTVDEHEPLCGIGAENVQLQREPRQNDAARRELEIGRAHV